MLLIDSCMLNYNLQFQTDYYLECHLFDWIVTGHRDVWRFEETLWYFEISSAASQSTCTMLTELGLLLVRKVKTFLFQKVKAIPVYIIRENLFLDTETFEDLERHYDTLKSVARLHNQLVQCSRNLVYYLFEK